jgi:hypothetical protein
MQRFLDLFIPINCSTCFRRILRPSSGAQNCTYNVRYCQINTAACCYRRWDGTQFHLIHDSSNIGLTISDAVCTVLCSWWWAEEPPETCRAIYRNKKSIPFIFNDESTGSCICLRLDLYVSHVKLNGIVEVGNTTMLSATCHCQLDQNIDCCTTMRLG